MMAQPPSRLGSLVAGVVIGPNGVILPRHSPASSRPPRAGSGSTPLPPKNGASTPAEYRSAVVTTRPVMKPPPKLMVASVASEKDLGIDDYDEPPDERHLTPIRQSAPVVHGADRLRGLASQRVSAAGQSSGGLTKAGFDGRARQAAILCKVAAAICLRPGVDSDPTERSQSFALLLARMAEAVSLFDANGPVDASIKESVAEMSAKLWEAGREVLIPEVSQLVASQLQQASESPGLSFCYAPVHIQQGHRDEARLALARMSWELLSAILQPELSLAGSQFLWGYGEPTEVVALFHRPIFEAAQEFASAYQDPEVRAASFQDSVAQLSCLIARSYVSKTREAIQWVEGAETSEEHGQCLAEVKGRFVDEIQPGVVAHACNNLSLLNAHAAHMLRSFDQRQDQPVYSNLERNR